MVEHEAIVLEGNPEKATVIIEFESVEAAQQWYQSPEYQSIKHLRTESSKGSIIITRRFEMPVK